MPSQHRILALVYHEFEAVDFFGPLGSILPHNDYYTLKVASLRPESPDQHGVESSIKNDIGTVPNISLAEALRDDEEHHFDTLFIPGGLGSRPLLQDSKTLKQIGELADRAANIFTVCTGSLLLAATGRLDGRKATTNKRLFDEMTSKYTGVQWQKRARWVEDGKFLTSSGITAGMDAGFAFIANTWVAPEDRRSDDPSQKVSAKGDATDISGFDKGKALKHANEVAFNMEYRWHSDSTDDPFV